MKVTIKDFYETDEPSEEYPGTLKFTGGHAELHFDEEDGASTVYEGYGVGDGRWLLLCKKTGRRASLTRSALNEGGYEGSFTYRLPAGESYSGMWQIEPV